ncbi:MAG: AraC family transcriptional regulator [Spirochaetota bacterium]
MSAGTWPRERRTLSTYAVVYVARGSVEFASHYTAQRTINAGEAYFLFPGVWHTYGSLSTPSTHYWFLFEGDIADRWRDNGMLDPARPVIHLGNDRSVRTRWNACIALKDRHPARYIDRITEIMTGMLAGMLLRGRTEAALTREHEAVSRVIQGMKSKVADASFDLAFFCESASLSYEYVRKIFPRIAGSAPGAYFKMLKMDSARKRLAGGTDTIASIASSLGFDDPFYFSRWFKKFERVSPAQYRASFGDFYGRPGAMGNK